MNLFIAVVIQGYNMPIRENHAELMPNHIEEFIEKWSLYDPKATGFITPYDLAFILLECPFPLGILFILHLLFIIRH